MLIFLFWSVLGSAVSGISSLIGGASANKARAREAQLSRDFSREESGTQRMFQERMRNTQWQAGVEDMRAAGLNPALAYSQGPAASPGGAMGQSQAARQEDVVTPAVSSALQYKRLNAEIGAIKAGIGRTKAETEQIRGRPQRILEPAVDRVSDFVERALSPGGMRGMVESGAQGIRRMMQRIEDTVARITKRPFVGRPTIGPNTTRRR